MTTRSTPILVVLLCAFALSVAATGCESDGGSGGGDITPTPDADGDTTADVPPGACDPVAQTGCEDDEVCSYDQGASTPGCFLAGDVESGEACGADAGCASGICLSLNQTESRCYAFCESVADCGPDVDCLDLDGAAYDVCEIDGIYDTCDLVEQDCADDKGCYGVDGEPEPICLPPGDVAAGEACDAANDCVVGAVCVGDTCRTVCDTTDGEACGDGTCEGLPDSEAGYCNPDE